MIYKYAYRVAALFSALLVFSCNSTPNNEQIQQSVNDSLQMNGNTKQVSASVADGTVTLSGTCEGNNCVTETENRIKNMPGVKDIKNNVTMAPQNTDLTLRTKVQNITSKYVGVQSEVSDGVIVLRGSISRDLLQPLMAELSSLQATKISNQLALK